MSERTLYIVLALFFVIITGAIGSTLWLIAARSPIMFLKIDPTGNCVASGNVWLAFEGRCVGPPAPRITQDCETP